MNTTIIEINHSLKKYQRNVILNIEKLNFEYGKSYLLMGANGSGKSTLIKSIVNLVKLTSGQIIKQTVRLGYLPEKYYFPDFCTVYNFLMMKLELTNYSEDEKRKQIFSFCKDWEIDYKKKVSALSKGMMQKLMIIYTLIDNPDLIIFDEPMNGLDLQSQKKLINIIKELKKNKKTLIITTHYPTLYRYCYHHIINLINGEIINENI